MTFGVGSRFRWELAIPGPDAARAKPSREEGALCQRSILARYREEGVTIASTSFEIAAVPDLRLRPAADVRAGDKDAHAGE